MTAALMAVGILCLALIWLNDRQASRRQDAEQAWTDERRELLTRIQRPELVPVSHGPVKQAPPPRDAAELATVGTVMPLRDEEPDA